MIRRSLPVALLALAAASPAVAQDGPMSPYPATLDLQDGRSAFDAFSIVRLREADIGLGNRLGTNVDVLGDVDGDGVDDVAFYSNTFADRLRGAARSRIVFGGTGLDAQRLVTLTARGDAPVDDLRSISVEGGIRLRALGDVNADGIADFGGTYGERFAEGTFVVHGRPDLATLGDTTARALADTLLEPLPSPPATSVSTFTMSRAPQFLNAAGDLDGDGIDDIVIGDVDVNTGDGANANAGAVAIVHGRAGGLGARFDPASLDGANGYIVEGVRNNQRFGAIAEPAGDFDGDGIDDLAIGSRNTESWLLYGSRTPRPARLSLFSLDGTAGFGFDVRSGGGTKGQGHEGMALAAAGDFDGDGFDDLVAGLAGASPGGRAYVIFGTDARQPRQVLLDVDDSLDSLLVTGESAAYTPMIDGAGPESQSEFLGFAVAGGTDLNGDDLDDALLGAPFSRPEPIRNPLTRSTVRTTTGSLYIVYGRPDRSAGGPLDTAGLDGRDGVEIAGEFPRSVRDVDDISGPAHFDRTVVPYSGANASFGYAVSADGDVTGDGRPDILVGAPNLRFGEDPYLGPNGQLYLIPGRTADGGSDPVAPPPPAADVEPVTGLRATVYSTTAAELFWDRPDVPGTSHEVRTAGTEDAAIARTDGISYFLDGLEPGTSGAYAVVAIGPDGRRAVPTLVAVDTPGTRARPPSIPAAAGLRLTRYSPTAIELFWERVPGRNLSYVIERDGRRIGTTRGTSFFDDGLAAGRDAVYRVRTVDEDRDSFGTESSIVGTDPSIDGERPPAPEGGRFERYSRSAVELFWERPDPALGIVATRVSRDGAFVGETDGTSLFIDDADFGGVRSVYALVHVGRNGRFSPGTVVREE